MLHFSERKKDCFGRLPVERPHGEVVVLPLPDCELFLEILERVELVGSVEFLVILAMAAFDLSVVSGSKWTDQLVPDPKLCQCALEQSRLLRSV